LDRSCELLVRIKRRGEPLNFRGKFGVDLFSSFPPASNSARERELAPRTDPVAESDIESHYFRAVVAQDVQRLGEV